MLKKASSRLLLRSATMSKKDNLSKNLWRLLLFDVSRLPGFLFFTQIWFLRSWVTSTEVIWKQGESRKMRARSKRSFHDDSKSLNDNCQIGIWTICTVGVNCSKPLSDWKLYAKECPELTPDVPRAEEKQKYISQELYSPTCTRRGEIPGTLTGGSIL